MPSGRVLVVGSVNVDLVVAAPRLPVPGQTVTGGDLVRYHGGKGGNQATAAARLGAAVAMIGAVGADDMGVEARSALEMEGIETRGLATAERPTGVALIIVDRRAENLIAVAPGANGEVHATQVEAALRQLAPGPGDVVLACREIPADGVRAALDAGRRAGATTILNPAPADDLDVATIALADILTPNETELAILAGGNAGEIPEAAARRLLAHRGAADAHDAEVGAPAAGDAAARRVPAVVVTLGAGGALVVEEGSAGVAVPAPAVHPVDTTGAGDTFNGALAAGLADGLGLLEAVRHAVAAAALSTTRPGARGGMPTRVELERFLGDG
jgi:ribokinase